MKYLITWIAWAVFMSLSYYCRHHAKKWDSYAENLTEDSIRRARARVKGGEWQAVQGSDAVLLAKIGCLKMSTKWGIYASICSVLAICCIILGLFST